MTLLAGCAGPRETVDTEQADELRSVIAAAREAGEAGEYERALDLYMSIMNETDNVAVARGAAQLASAMEDWPAAGAAAERWLELRPDSQSAAQLAVIAALRQNRLEHSVKLLRSEILSQADPDASWMAAIALLAAADSDERARKGLEHLLRMGAPLPDGFDSYQRSRLARQLGDADNAAELAVQAYSAAPDFERAMWASHTAEEAGQAERALDFLRRAREHRPDHPEVALAESDLLRELGRVDEALQTLDGLADSPEVLYSRGMLEQQLEQTGPAKESWRRLAALEVDSDPDRHAWLTGLLAEVLEMNAEAQQWYRRVGGELSTRASLRRALLLADQGRIDEARSLLSGLRNLPDPEMVEQAWLVEAQILVDQGQADSAIDMLSQALVEMPGSTALLYGSDRSPTRGLEHHRAGARTGAGKSSHSRFDGLGPVQARACRAGLAVSAKGRRCGCPPGNCRPFD
ncbi:MAG: tetratricopeptide repeat protein [Xanthomonadaceae bacterium]|nr:tetratricopeptide repeat protein [Xanthomonadaceae bacterium]